MSRFVNKDTKLLFSVSSSPGNFGATFFNAAFMETSINALYIPLKLSKDRCFFKFADSLANIEFLGLSVSMPFKVNAYRWCSCLDKVFSKTSTGYKLKNVNTIKYDKSFGYTGHNTDTVGFERACLEFLENCKTALIYGDGAVCESICHVLKRYNIDWKKAKRGEEDSINSNREFLINTSPVGMNGITDNIFSKDNTRGYKYVFDVVGKNNTNLIRCATDNGAKTISGPAMQFEGACKQFEIYTGIVAPKKFLKKYMKSFGYDV